MFPDVPVVLCGEETGAGDPKREAEPDGEMTHGSKKRRVEATVASRDAAPGSENEIVRANYGAERQGEPQTADCLGDGETSGNEMEALYSSGSEYVPDSESGENRFAHFS